MNHARDIAAAAAMNPLQVDRVCADHGIDLFDHTVKIGGQNIPVPLAMHYVLVRLEQGDAPAAQCIKDDCLAAIEAALLPWAEDEAERRIRADNEAARADEAAARAEDRALRGRYSSTQPWSFGGSL